MRAPATLANLTERSTVLSPDRDHVLSFDREGRLLYFFRRGQTYKRSLGSEVHLRYRNGLRQRRKLDRQDTARLFAEVLELARSLLRRCQGEARRRLADEILRWTVEGLLAEERRFQTAYKPISILPPDQYRAIVLQATEGCSWNRCTFCNFYMDRPFAVRSVEDFERHLVAVKELLGAGILLRRGVFLADGNALALSNRRLVPLLDRIAEAFSGEEIFGFVDLFSGERRSESDWSLLRERGLRRIYLGMETGDEALLRWVNKPGSPMELEDFVAVLKATGIEVGLILMIGLGGSEHRHRHREASLDLLQRLSLDTNDLIYLSPFVEHGGTTYGHDRRAMGWTAMSESEIDAELKDIAKELRHEGLRVGRYDIREFIY